MSDINEMLIDSTKKIMRDFSTKETIVETENGIWPKDLWQIIEESGLTTVAISEENGGTGGTFGDAISMLRVIGKFAAPIPLPETLLANWLLADIGLRASIKPLTLSSIDEKDNFTFTEVEGGWSLTGASNYIPWARFVEGIVIIGTSEKETLITVVDPALCQIKPGTNLGGESRDFVEIQDQFIKKVEVIAVTEAVLMSNYYKGTIIKTALMAGSLERLLELTAAYTKERSQFGRPIHRFQAIQNHLAVLSGEATAAKIAADNLIEAVDTNSYETQAMITKIVVGEAASKSVPIAHQVLGAIGFTDEHVLQFTTRRLWAWRDEYGTESEWAEQLGAQVINNGPEEFWPFITALD
ncbi:acyl-CoA dehydrogenase family protein [Planococcus salinus]|uniref:Acyl-CoA dehydrogenase n=1 Tax=Planococcus salinus TaxID=1848460 RepID=A0A3M8P985_9BACL|nr:acyl-CoA dehydrogenase family protein [Planococcus salinus]RNF39744.1 acyl-CoA dehydrogenase [Planococcus salinus]